MSPSLDRRRVLRGMLGGSAVTVGLPLLDCFLDTNGTALASGAPLPACFGSWFQGLGFTPGHWEPKTIGANYEFGPQIKVLSPFRDRINIFSGLKINLDGHPSNAHSTGPQGCLQGALPEASIIQLPTIDSLIADVIGTKTRFRSLEVSCDGTPTSYSRRGGTVINPSETSPVALYTRIFGPEFKDPNAAEFTPDPKVMARRSALSGINEERERVMRQLGATDRARLDEYFTSLRSLEQQLDLELQKPAPLESCVVPAKASQAIPGTIIEDAHANHRLFAKLLGHALACGQTRVFNVNFAGSTSGLRRSGSQQTYHIYTHEEAIDPKLGYQPIVVWFNLQIADAMLALLQTLDSIREGDGTLLDRSLVFYSTDSGHAQLHTLDNIPLMTFGRAAGRIKTGFHITAKSDPVTRVGLTIQQALGVPTGNWGRESNLTSKPFAELLT